MNVRRALLMGCMAIPVLIYITACAEEEGARMIRDFVKQLTPEVADLLGDPAKLENLTGMKLRKNC